MDTSAILLSSEDGNLSSNSAQTDSSSITPFLQGRVESSSAQFLYISVGSGHWLTIPWEQILAEIYRSKTLTAAVLAGLSANIQPKNEVIPVPQISVPSTPAPPTFSLAASELRPVALPLPPTPSSVSIPAMPETPVRQPFSTNTIDAASTLAAFNDSSVPIVGGHYPAVVVAPADTIDRLILSERAYNTEQREYVWSHASLELYEVDSQEGQLALQESATIRMIYPPGTMLLARDADGHEASPAWVARRADMKPSNEWLKAQTCHHMCEAYRSGTSRLSRAATIRSHFQKCVWLHEHHPLKIHSSLHLQIHELRKNGLIPQKARSRALHFGYLNPVGGLPKSEKALVPAPIKVPRPSSPLWSPLSSAISSQNNSPYLTDAHDRSDTQDYRMMTRSQGWVGKKRKIDYAQDEYNSEA